VPAEPIAPRTVGWPAACRDETYSGDDRVELVALLVFACEIVTG